MPHGPRSPFGLDDLLRGDSDSEDADVSLKMHAQAPVAVGGRTHGWAVMVPRAGGAGVRNWISPPQKTITLHGALNCTTGSLAVV